VFDAHLNRQHRLTYFIRGPEWAFAIPQGDVAVLEDVMRRCATFWNGAGSLLIPVRADGRMPRSLDILLQTRPVDACYMHEELGDVARTAVQERIPGAVRLWDGFDDRELHPLHLRERRVSGDEPKPTLELPQFRSAALRRAALAIWGDILDDDMPAWQERYEVASCDGEAAHGALLRGQLAGPSTSPLHLTARHMGVVQGSGPEWPHIWVLAQASFGQLVNFWNFRARVLARPNGAGVVGIPRESLRHPQQLRALADWLPRVPGMRMTPDVYVASPDALDEEVRAALAEVPLPEETVPRHGHQIGRGVEPNDPPTFSFARPYLAGPFVRGASATTLVAFNDGRSSLALPAPAGFEVRSVGHTRLVFSNLPLPLPVTGSAARRVHEHAQACDGVMLLTDAAPQWNFEVRLPTAGEALQDWVADHGFVLTRSDDGRDAEALLQRLGSLEALDVLADRKRLALLQALAPASRKKLAQRLVARARDEGAVLNEDAMMERLADIGLFLEAQARTANDIATTMGPGTKKREVYALLPPLVEAGFVRRAHSLRCPQCRFLQLLDLSAQDERVRCRACGELFVMPVVDESGRREPELFYRLDGLMARVMDQDILPVLLTLRAVRPPPESSDLFFAWPGVEVKKGEDPEVDIDLLVSNGSAVWAFEVKQNATGLKAPQLRRLMETAAALGARPGIAAAEGEFAPELVERVLEASGQVLTGAQLLP
jgi:hypothetical protein